MLILNTLGYFTKIYNYYDSMTIISMSLNCS